ncbi:BREX-1 system adenine-specific DNA-methyltransferase PglX [Bizionia sp.]|uniref:BREX-1 system adenine-specific DNA-methyltransferase PglX n=1 Tax=Bizionia sp. TaxID=1954480 RepID=UPI003A911F9C
MNTNNLKRFAQAARLKLLDQIGAKLEKVLTTDSAELREKANQIKQLQEAINKSNKQQVIDTVAYTWFNRLVALRFMDVNGYEPIGIKVVSPASKATLPELLQEAKDGNIPQELPVNHQRIYQILDGSIPSANAQNEAYREVLVGACNHLHTVFPFLFERINDYSELLLPDDLISSFSIIEDIKQGMLPEDCQEVEILGWLYQFYISEKKDEVFAAKGKVKKEDIPAATQLFTPRWIVEYMVQNTVGKLWLQNNPKSNLREHMPYFIESPSVESDDYLKINSVEEITLLDQACGSGHILVYGFELLSKIYEEEGYNESEIPKLIIEKNLYGFEIDERAAQLAGLALMLKARSYQRRVFKKEITPNILCYKDLKLTAEDLKDSFTQIGFKATEALLFDLNNMQQATNLGSLIIPQTNSQELANVLEVVNSKLNTNDIFLKQNLNQIKEALEQLVLLSNKYHCVVDNPPYMGGGNMNKPLAEFVKTNYPKSKADLMACFMEAGLASLEPKGFLGMINQHSWMFLSSYEKLRVQLIDTIYFDTMLHLGSRTFPEIGGEVVQNASFTFWHTTLDEKGRYVRLVDENSSELKRSKTREAIQNPDSGWLYTANQNDFLNIPGNPIGYWLSVNEKKILNKAEFFEAISNPCTGMQTGSNPKFTRYWFEVFRGKIDGYKIPFNKRWCRYQMGGDSVKWISNPDMIIDWEKDGFAVINNKSSVIRNKSFYGKKGISWKRISSSDNRLKILQEGMIFDQSADSLFLNDEEDFLYVFGYLNSKVLRKYFDIFSPTLNLTSGSIEKLPIYITQNTDINNFVKNCINISLENQLMNENHIDFIQNELIRIKGQDIEEAYDSYCHYWQNKFFELHKNEEALNKQFIDIYGLQDELTPDVPLEDITILKEETDIVNGELVFDAKEILQQFVSYAVGCMFGRYSLDKPGLILANQGETLEDYLNTVGYSAVETSFLPDDDNIIPILDNEWFEDDIVGRFYEFLKVTFGKANFEKNLAFVEECLGKDIRKYFLKDFYSDHVKRYKKRPIYWMFSSPSGAFNVLIYMHRYTPDTLNQILNGYLKDYREKLTAELDRQAHLKNVGTAREQTLATKEEDRIRKVLLELQEYERELYKMATERISIDLDDGALVNYNKFGNIIKPVSGLNDKKTKKKVKEFDWIDVTEIR